MQRSCAIFIAGYGYAKGSALTDPPLPLDNVSNDTHVGVVAYANVLGKPSPMFQSNLN